MREFRVQPSTLAGLAPQKFTTPVVRVHCSHGASSTAGGQAGSVDSLCRNAGRGYTGDTSEWYKSSFLTMRVQTQSLQTSSSRCGSLFILIPIQLREFVLCCGIFGSFVGRISYAYEPWKPNLNVEGLAFPPLTEKRASLGLLTEIPRSPTSPCAAVYTGERVKSAPRIL